MALGLESDRNIQLPKFSQLFDVETNELIENYSDWYQPTKHQKELEEFKKQLSDTTSQFGSGTPEGSVVSLINKKNHVETLDLKRRALVDIFSIPSSSSVMKLEIFSSNEEKEKTIHSHLEKVKINFDNIQVEGTELFDQVLPNLRNI